MNVLYDLSVIGTGYYNLRARTGIFTVVDNLAEQLVLHNNVNADFCISRSKRELVGAIAYLKENTEKEYEILLKGDQAINAFIINLLMEANSEKNAQSNVNYWSIANKKLQIIDCLLKLSGLFVNRSRLLSSQKYGTPDIFHSPFYPLPELFRNDNRKVRRFITIYDLIPILYPKYFQYKEDHLLNRIVGSITRDDWVICISHATKNDLCSYNSKLDENRVFVTHLGASDNFYKCDDDALKNEVLKKYGIPEGAEYYLSLSTIEPRKNIVQIIKSFVQIIQQEKKQDLYLVLAGAKGWDFDEIFNELGRANEIKKGIIVTGYVDYADLAPLYSGAIAFVYPSFYEGFGLPPLEAMKCGVPVITSNTSSLPEVVGDAGIMVDPNDTDELCQSMLDVYNNVTLRVNLSDKSLIRSKQFTWENCAQQTVKAYEQALR